MEAQKEASVTKIKLEEQLETKTAQLEIAGIEGYNIYRLILS